MSVRRVAVRLDPLEARVFLDAVPLSVSTELTPLGPELRIVGTTGDDKIYLARRDRATYITNGTGWSIRWEDSANTIRVEGLGGDDRIVIRSNIWTPAAIYGGDGRDTIYGGTGTDRLYGGNGVDYLIGGEGDDTIVAVGDDAADRVTGGGGIDSFWLDATGRERLLDLEDAELLRRAEHRIHSFIGGQTIEGEEDDGFPIAVAGQVLSNPVLTPAAAGFLNFASHSLFSRAGPQMTDIVQGSLDDCYLLAALGALAQTDPRVLRHSMASLGDGTFAVRFFGLAGEVYVRVDADLPVDQSGALVYAGFGDQQSIWAPIFEKAYAFYRLGDGAYGSLNGGFSGEIFQDLGLDVVSSFTGSSADELLLQFAAQLANGDVVVLGTDYTPGDAPVISGHAYVVSEVTLDEIGEPVALRLFNPWGRDGAGDDGVDDGFISLSPEQAMDAFWFSVSAESGLPAVQSLP